MSAKTRIARYFLFCALGAAACSQQAPVDMAGEDGAADDGATDTPDLATSLVPLCDSSARSANHYFDIGGAELGGDRISIYAQPMGVERLRMKSKSVLHTKYPDQTIIGEYKRVTGVENLSNTVIYNLSTLAGAPSNWSEAPDHSSVTMYAYSLAAFQVCYSYVQLGNRPADDPFIYSATDPTTDTVAVDQCRIMARKFWNRTPTQGEVDSCATLAKTQTPDPSATNATNARLRRWALACGSLLTSTHFLTY